MSEFDKDLAKVVQVELAEVAEVAVLSGHRSPDVIRNWERRAANGGLVMFAVKMSGEVMGSVNILLDGADEQAVKDEIGVDVPIINALGVNEQYRGQGLGSQLMDACEGYIRSHLGLPQKLALGVETDNAIARAMYEQRGYQYKTVDGQKTYESSWPEVDKDGNRTMYTAQCLLMIKNLN